MPSGLCSRDSLAAFFFARRRRAALPSVIVLGRACMRISPVQCGAAGAHSSVGPIVTGRAAAGGLKTWADPALAPRFLAPAAPLAPPAPHLAELLPALAELLPLL